MVFGKQSLQGYESNRRNADGVRVENIPRNHNVGPPREDSKSNERSTQCEPEHFKDRIIFMSMYKDRIIFMSMYKDRIIFMSMYNDIAWQAKGNKEQCEHNSQTVVNYARKFPRGQWSSWGLDQKRNGNQMDHGIEWQKK